MTGTNKTSGFVGGDIIRSTSDINSQIKTGCVYEVVGIVKGLGLRRGQVGYRLIGPDGQQFTTFRHLNWIGA